MTQHLTTQRLSRLRQRMKETQTDLVALGPSSHMQWLLGLNPHGDERPVMAIVTADHIAVLMPLLNAESSRAQCDAPFFEWSDDEGPTDALKRLLKDCAALGPNLNIVIDETMRTDFAFLLLDNLNAPKHRFTEDTIGSLRAEKDEDEYQALKASAVLNDRAFEVGFAALRNGVSEFDIRDVIVNYYKENNAQVEFCIVAFGANSAYPHHHTGGDTLKPNMAVLIDSGCRLNGYPSDMTRCAWYGLPNEEFLEIGKVVKSAAESATNAAKSGVLCKDVDRAARQVISDAGYGENFSHRTGHGLGIDVHEPPYLTATSNTPLAAGNVFSVEPGVYIGGSFGIRLENIIFQRPDAAEVLSEMPLDVRIIPERA